MDNATLKQKDEYSLDTISYKLSVVQLSFKLTKICKYLSFTWLLLLTSTSCAQKTNNSSNNFRTHIYDTCRLIGENKVPRDYWYGVDDNLHLDRDVDSVLYLKVIGRIDERYGIPKSEKARAMRLEDLHKCSSLGFFEFSSTSIGENSQGLLDFKNFPELRYVHSDYLFKEKQFTDLLCTAKNLKGLKVKINFPVPECLCELEQLSYLIITNYGGVSLPTCIEDMPNLKYLELNGGGIGGDGMLNETIWNISSLELLTIDGGSHVDIQPSVKNMTHLKQLNITSVDSVSFSDKFKELDSLELLILIWIDKKIKFPSNFNDLTNLKGIKLAQARVNQLPIINNHSNIEYIVYNDIHELDSVKNLNFYNLGQLKHLSLQGSFSQFDSIPKGIESLPALESIELHGFGFPSHSSYYQDFKNRINEYTYSNEFGDGFGLTFDHYRWLFILGEPSKYNPKMY